MSYNPKETTFEKSYEQEDYQKGKGPYTNTVRIERTTRETPFNSDTYPAFIHHIKVRRNAFLSWTPLTKRDIKKLIKVLTTILEKSK